MSVISLKNLGKRYGQRNGVVDLSLDVSEGTILGFLGPNGAGKSTTIRILLGLLRPTTGKAHVFGKDCFRHASDLHAEIGYLPGDLRLYPWLTGATALQLFSRIRRRDLAPEGKRLIDRFRFDPNVHVRSMSRGMRQKLGLILALAHRPRMLILDEPTSSLDPLMQTELYNELRSVADQGRTVFLSSHTLVEVQALCEQIAILRDGRLVAAETISSLRLRAPRSVAIRWRTAENCLAPPPEGLLEVTEQKAKVWKARLTGNTVDLIQWSARQSIEDLVIEEPDLSSLFQEYYK